MGYHYKVDLNAEISVEVDAENENEAIQFAIGDVEDGMISADWQVRGVSSNER